ncbi:hypothetical protein [Sporolactobacillus sp. KGMB 08714]|uniref:hypothetical protein n=1 Tax=Sporolactobacillus sp. KGMB 08714 TaxID=3064704 RepID=UPI002FBD3E13
MAHLFDEIYLRNIRLTKQNKGYRLWTTQALPPELRQAFKENRKRIRDRFMENAAARRLGFLVFGHGTFYVYQYGEGSFLFIERKGVTEESADVWREKFFGGKKRSQGTVMVAENIPFNEAWREAQSFVTWIHRKRKQPMMNKPNKEETLWEMI